MQSKKCRQPSRKVPSQIQVVAMKTILNFLNDESGATAIEYGLMSAIIFIGLLTTLTTFNGSIVGYYERIVAATLNAFGMSP
jgi:pilus assembly protein Flp/PilA